MKKFIIETMTCEFEVPETVLDRMINSFVLDGYEIFNDDTNELFFEDSTGDSPRMVFRELAAQFPAFYPLPYGVGDNGPGITPAYPNEGFTMNNWTVFVGGVEVNDFYLSETEAKNLAQNYQNEGYDDAIAIMVQS